MITRPLGKQDYDHIVQIIDRWWGGPTTALAHPMFFYELGAMARVVEHDGILVGFLLGFVAPGPPKTGYVHLVGIHPDYRRRGVGKVLYQTFEEDCARRRLHAPQGDHHDSATKARSRSTKRPAGASRTSKITRARRGPGSSSTRRLMTEQT